MKCIWREFGVLGVIMLFIGLIGLSESHGFSHFAKNPTSGRTTRGEPWPKPQLVNQKKAFMVIRPQLFQFQVLDKTCEILEAALKRYYTIIIRSNGLRMDALHGFQHNLTTFIHLKESGVNRSWKTHKDWAGYLDVVGVQLMESCDGAWPNEGIDESYEIGINGIKFPGKGFLIAPTVWGMLRALETFSQLLVPTDNFTALKLRTTDIVDFPRFSYRSVLLDTSRHFLSKRVLFQNLDLMAMNKLNVFHWHIVDDQSFPFQSRTFPALSEKGAYHRYTHVYTSKDVQDILQYARFRGIRVVPEFDTPGHTNSWGPSQPLLLTTCYNKTTGVPDGTFGPIDPTHSPNFDFLRSLFQEVVETFPDNYIHLGGDEVDATCWKSNPSVEDFMRRMNFSSDFTRLEDFYMGHLMGIVREFPQNKSCLVWQEVFNNGVTLHPASIVHIWEREDEKGELRNVTAKGFRVIFSSCWYLNYISYGVDWHPYYVCDPQDFNGTESQKELVLGGGPVMWGEMVDSTNLIPRLWPRASVPAERLWSSAKVNDTKMAAPRLEEHRCRLLRRGFPVEPISGPGFCPGITWN